MGRRLARVDARQHPDLTTSEQESRASRWTGFVLLALLSIDGVLSAIVGALFLPSYVGAVPLPVSALISGLLNAALVWAALRWTSVPWVAALPLATFLLTSIVLTFGGPGGDVVFGGRGVFAFGSLLFIAVGAIPPALVLRRRFGQPS